MKTPFRSFLVVTTLAVLLTIAFWFMARANAPVVGAQVRPPATFVIGTRIANMSSQEISLFNAGFQPFNKVWDPQQGLGPVFTQDQCTVCHADPGNVAGGNSTQKVEFVGKFNTDGTYNDLSTSPNEGGPQIQPMSAQKFKPACILKGEVKPADATIDAFHQAPQLFGLGLIDNIADADILAQAIDKGMGVFGNANMVMDENGVLRPGRFGYKAQAPDLLFMTANAELHELGVTNAIFSAEDKPQGLSFPQACSIKTQPNDVNATQLINMYHYLLYLGPKTPGAPNPNGQAKFTSVGCILCHVQSYKTTATVTVPLVYPPTSTITSTSLANKTVKLYSDLLLHDLGGTNADGLQVGIATGTQFRTTPLWGLSTRLSSGDGLMHDGKALDIPTVLSRHGGEATQVIANFNALSAQDQADLIAFISAL
jgi:CxxC motif-containing protein (DUF1111 family)